MTLVPETECCPKPQEDGGRLENSQQATLGHHSLCRKAGRRNWWPKASCCQGTQVDNFLSSSLKTKEICFAS